MSDSTVFMIDRSDAPAAIGLASLFAGVDGLARAVGVVALGSFLLGVTVVLIAAAA